MKITLIIFLVLIALTGCNTTSQSSATEIADTVYCPKYAERFLILKKKDSIYLIVRNPWQGARNNKTYNITTPYEHIIAMSTSHLAYLEAINCDKKVVGISGKNYIYSKSYQNTVDIGYDRHLEFEKVLSLKPDAMFVYEIAGESSSIFGKLSTLGVNVMYIADYLEKSPLGRAEWIIAFGAMTNHFEEAKEYFSKVETKYNNLKKNTKSRNTTVILNSPYQDIWYFPVAQSYPVKFIEDAGGEYIGKDYQGDHSIPVSTETAYKLVKQSDIWLNPSVGTTSKKVLYDRNPSLSDIDIPIFDNNKRSTAYGGSDYYETGIVRPDLVLKDLITIFSEKSNTIDDSLFFYHQIY